MKNLFILAFLFSLNAQASQKSIFCKVTESYDPPPYDHSSELNRRIEFKDQNVGYGEIASDLFQDSTYMILADERLDILRITLQIDKNGDRDNIQSYGKLSTGNREVSLHISRNKHLEDGRLQYRSQAITCTVR